ncbi:MAG: hypothetical protein ACYS21_16165 [Planctomycetota bacterium]|jgi:hypothetical protein
MDSSEIKPEPHVDPSSGGGGSDSSGSAGGAGSGRIWKTGVFIAVALLASGLAAHSILTANRCGGGACGVTSILAGCPAEADLQAKACLSEKSCTHAKATSKSQGCPSEKRTEKVCPNSPGTVAPGCCPGGSYRLGRK